MFVVHIRNWC
jgi:hypothetical protein